MAGASLVEALQAAGAGHEPLPRTNWQRSAEYAVEQWLGDAAYVLALDRTTWAKRMLLGAAPPSGLAPKFAEGLLSIA